VEKTRTWHGIVLASGRFRMVGAGLDLLALPMMYTGI
jgi:hypothetical protein